MQREAEELLGPALGHASGQPQLSSTTEVTCSAFCTPFALPRPVPPLFSCFVVAHPASCSATATLPSRLRRRRLHQRRRQLPKRRRRPAAETRLWAFLWYTKWAGMAIGSRATKLAAGAAARRLSSAAADTAGLHVGLPTQWLRWKQRDVAHATRHESCMAYLGGDCAAMAGCADRGRRCRQCL